MFGAYPASETAPGSLQILTATQVVCVSSGAILNLQGKQNRAQSILKVGDVKTKNAHDVSNPNRYNK